MNLIVSLGTYHFSDEYSVQYLPYFRHPWDVTKVFVNQSSLRTKSSYNSHREHKKSSITQVLLIMFSLYTSSNTNPITISTEVAWTDTAAGMSTAVAIPKFGDIMHSSEGTIFPWSGSDPDSEIQCFSYKESDKIWNYVGTYDETKARRNKGAEHIGMYRMLGFKYSTKIKENCTTFTGTTPYNGITPKDNTPTMTLTNYKQSTTCRHMIINGLFDLFIIVNTICNYWTRIRLIL